MRGFFLCVLVAVAAGTGVGLAADGVTLTSEKTRYAIPPGIADRGGGLPPSATVRFRVGPEGVWNGRNLTVFLCSGGHFQLESPPDEGAVQPSCQPERLAYTGRIDGIQGPIVETGIAVAGRYEALALTYDQQTGIYDRSNVTAIEVTDECGWRVGASSQGLYETLRGHPFPCSGGSLEGEVSLRGADGSRLTFRGPAGSISTDSLAQENRWLPRDILVGLGDRSNSSAGPKKPGSVRYSNGPQLARFMTRLDTPLVFTAALGRVDYSVVHVPGKGTTVRVFKGRVIARRRTGSSISDYLTFKCSRRVTWRCLAGMKFYLGGRERPVTVLRAGQKAVFKPIQQVSS